jgi:hypothetical protein
VVLLDELDLDPELAPGVLSKGLDEEAALVAVDLGLDQDNAVELRLEATSHQPRARPYWRS